MLSGQYFRLARDSDSATIVLIVLARVIVNGGSFGFGSSYEGTGFGSVYPYEKPTLTTVLRVGECRLIMQSEGGTWTAAAKKAVEDVEAW